MYNGKVGNEFFNSARNNEQKCRSCRIFRRNNRIVVHRQTVRKKDTSSFYISIMSGIMYVLYSQHNTIFCDALKQNK